MYTGYLCLRFSDLCALDDPDDIECISENYVINKILIKTGKNKDEADDASKNKVYEYIP